MSWLSSDNILMRTLSYLLVVVITGFDNHLVRRLCRRSLFGCRRVNVESIHIKDVYVDFDKCRREGRKTIIDEGFMLAGDRISPHCEVNEKRIPRPDRWQRAAQPPPAVKEVVSGKKTLLCPSFLSWANPAIMMRALCFLLHYLMQAGISPRNAQLIFINDAFHKEIGSLITCVFDDVSFAVMAHGKYFFRQLEYLPHLFNDNRPLFQPDTIECLRRQLAQAFGITLRERCRDVSKITFISRRNYRKGTTYINYVTRKVSNEDDILTALRQHFPAADVRKCSLEDLPMREQLHLIHDTDVLIGMHGAGLALTVMLPANAGVLELFPANLQLRYALRAFYHTITNNKCHYRRWINLKRRHEFMSEAWAAHLAMYPEVQRTQPARDFTTVPPQVIVRKVKSMQKQIRREARASRHC